MKLRGGFIQGMHEEAANADGVSSVCTRDTAPAVSRISSALRAQKLFTVKTRTYHGIFNMVGKFAGGAALLWRLSK